jgi:hypothetical protein
MLKEKKMPNKILLTTEQKEFILENRLKISASEMSRMWGYSEGVVQRWMKANKLSVSKVRIKMFISKGRMGETTSTPEIDKYLIDKYLTVSEKRMAVNINKSSTFVRKRLQQLGLKKTKWIINKFKKESQIKKGNVSANKGKKQSEYMSVEAIERTKGTRFKKGEIPPNKSHYRDGDITIRYGPHGSKGKPHKYIRIKLRVWQELQIHNWEKENGPVPEGFVLACKDGDTLNCDPSNWYPLSKQDNARRNAGHVNLPDSYLAHCIAGRKNKHLKPILLEQKELLDLKRNSIILNRSINEQRKESAKA